MSKLLIGALAVVLLSGCDDAGTDQCLRRELFQQCMKSLPAGPQSTKYNDWDEVVVECGHVAYYQSLRRRSQIKEECGL